MIYSETIEVIYSDVVLETVFSEEDPDYRRPMNLRELENEELRNLEDENKRILE